MASPDSTASNNATLNPSTAQSDIDPSPALPASTTFDLERDRHTRLERPKLTYLESSIIVPRLYPEIEIEEEEFPPDDARTMSPRRNSAEVERLANEARQVLEEQAKILQSSLTALAERIEGLTRVQDKLESENKSLKHYIGGLIRSRSKL